MGRLPYTPYYEVGGPRNLFDLKQIIDQESV